MQDATETLVAGTGDIHIAPYGTTLPTGATSVRETLDAAFVTLGLTTEDGVTWNDEIAVTDIRAWQSLYPVRRLVESYSGFVNFTLLQWNKDIMEQVFSGVVTEPVPNTVHKFTPTRDGVVVEKSIVVDFNDGAGEYRLVIPKVGLGSAIEVPLNAAGLAVIPTEWGVVGGDAAGPWFLLTDNPDFSVD